MLVIQNSNFKFYSEIERKTSCGIYFRLDINECYKNFWKKSLTVCEIEHKFWNTRLCHVKNYILYSPVRRVLFRLKRHECASYRYIIIHLTTWSGTRAKEIRSSDRLSLKHLGSIFFYFFIFDICYASRICAVYGIKREIYSIYCVCVLNCVSNMTSKLTLDIQARASAVSLADFMRICF